MVRGQQKGVTRGVIVAHKSLPRSLLRTNNQQLINLHTRLINEYLTHIKRAPWWQHEHSFATIGMYTAFFYRCLGDRLFVGQQLSPETLVQLYATSHRGHSFCNSTYGEHCRRLVVLGMLLFRLGILQGETITAHRRYVHTFFARQMRGTAHSAAKAAAKEFTPAEVHSLYAACQNCTEFVLLLLLFTTGIRIGGAVNLRVSGVQNADGTIKSEGTTTEKGAVQHRIFLCPVLRHWLGRYIAAAAATEYIFPARYGKQGPCSVGHLQRTFGRLCQRAQIAGPHNAHRTRHTLAHALRLTGTPSNHIQHMLGHTCPRTTDLYGALDTHELVRSMHLPWDGVRHDLCARDVSALLRSLCPPFVYRLPWMTPDDMAGLHTGIRADGVPIRIQDLVQLLTQLVTCGKSGRLQAPLRPARADSPNRSLVASPATTNGRPR